MTNTKDFFCSNEEVENSNDFPTCVLCGVEEIAKSESEDIFYSSCDTCIDNFDLKPKTKASKKNTRWGVYTSGDLVKVFDDEKAATDFTNDKNSKWITRSYFANPLEV